MATVGNAKSQSAWAEFFQLHPALRLLHTVDAARCRRARSQVRLQAESDAMQGFDAGKAVLGASGPFLPPLPGRAAVGGAFHLLGR